MELEELLHHELGKKFLGGTLAPVMGLYTFVIRQRLQFIPADLPKLAGLCWNLLVDRERDSWIEFVKRIHQLQDEYTRYTSPTDEFTAKVKIDASLIFGQLQSVEIHRPNLREFEARSVMRGVKDVFVHYEP